MYITNNISFYAIASCDIWGTSLMNTELLTLMDRQQELQDEDTGLLDFVVLLAVWDEFLV